MMTLGRVRKSVWLSTSAFVLCATFATPAFASGQQTADPPPAATTDEIVVTAQKRSQTLNKVSVAVTALSEQALQNAGVNTVADLTSSVPSVQIHTAGPVGYTGVAIRGITNQNFSQLGSPAVAAYVDGVYAPTSQAVSGGLYDIERIEVLRGPQGTTYGQNATGGNVNIITAAPKQTFGASTDLSYGSYNEVILHGMVNLPVTDDLAVRAAVIVRRSDGYFDTLGTTRRNYGAADEFGGRLSLLWTPTSNLTIRLTGEAFHNGGTPSNVLSQIGADGKPANGLSPYKEPFVGNHVEPSVDLTNYAVRARIDWNFADRFTLAYVGGYQHQTSSFIFGIAGAGFAPVYDSDWRDEVNADSNEVNLTYDGDRLQNIMGVSQFHKTDPYSNAFHFTALGSNQFRTGGADQSTFGVFDQATYKILSTVRLIGGVRWSRESQNTQGSYTTVNCPAPAGTPLTYDQIRAFSAANLSPGCTTSPVPYAEGTWKNVSWKGGVEWDVAPNSLAYASVTNGFKSGQVQPGLPTIFAPYVNPEEVINYEVGYKSRLFGDMLNIRTAAYYMNYKNIQVTAVTFINNFSYIFTQNAAKAGIYGAELEWELRPSRSDHLNGYLTYTHATYGDYTNAVNGLTGLPVGGNLKGNYLPGAPVWAAQIDYSHVFELGNGGKLTPEAVVYYQSKNYLREFNALIDKVDGYTKTSLILSYVDPSGRWKTSAFVHNLEDNAVRNYANTALKRYFSDYNPPRTWGIRIGYEFN